MQIIFPLNEDDRDRTSHGLPNDSTNHF